MCARCERVYECRFENGKVGAKVSQRVSLATEIAYVLFSLPPLTPPKNLSDVNAIW